MISMLKEMFAGRETAATDPSGHHPGRVNLERRFTTLAETSQGSMSRVFRAIDNENGQTVCVKVQIPEKNDAAAARAHAIKPCEGAIAARIRHLNVARTYEYGETTKGEHYLVMEYVDGVSLQYVRDSVHLNLGGQLKILIQAAEGFAAVHKAGFIHHDINPKNILINRQNQVKLIDFGLAVPNSPEFRKPGNRTGTLQYMAPELIRREAIDERIDIFAFGVLAFEFLTHKLPYGGGTSMAMMLQRINVDPIDPADANPKLPPELCDLLRRTLSRRKEDRWPDMASLAVRLCEIRESWSQRNRH